MTFAQVGDPPGQKPLEQPVDTVGIRDVDVFPEFPIAEQDSIVSDSTEVDSIIKKEPLLLDKISYKAKDYTRISQKEKKLYLYNEAELYYQDMELKAGIIIFDYEKNEVYAKGIVDSSGYTQRPVFKQRSEEVVSDSLRSNYDTKRALIWNSRTEQDNGLIMTTEVTKKENDSVYYLGRARVTTSKNLESPEYYMLIRKAKLVPNRKVVAGLSNMYIADVPTPILTPFAYFPLTGSRRSGVIIPVFGDDAERGFFIQNGGYYFAISDYADLTTLIDYYTNGGYALNVDSNYSLRYKFRGALGFRFENQIQGQRGFPNFSRTTIYNIRWTHSQDPKDNPNSRFSASVNFGSSQFFRQSINQLNAASTLNNTLSSSISYNKTFTGYPSVNMSLTATLSQNTQTEAINMTLPTLQASMERIFPLAKRDGIKKGVIQNINFQYNLRGEYNIQTTDSLFFSSEMFDNSRAGVQHTIPINTNFKIFDYLSVSMGGNVEENWGFETINNTDFIDEENPSVRDTIQGFDRFAQYNFSASVGTTIYGTFNRGDDKKIQAIRHVMRPSISYNINPGFDQFFETYQATADSTDIREYTRFEEFLFGRPNRMRSSSVGMSLNNTLEAKVRDRDTTATEPKKITILNNLNFSTAYNIAADSLPWSPLNITGNTSLFKNKMSINFGMTLDPYAIDNNGSRIDVFNIDNGGSLFRLTNANLNANYSFSSKDFVKKERDEESSTENTRSGGRDDDLFGVAQNFADRTRGDDDSDDVNQTPEKYNASVPWDFRLVYAVTYNNFSRQNEITNNSLMFSGNVDLTPNWSVGISSGYDFVQNGFTRTQLRFGRDLDSWQFNFSWIPFNPGSSWFFFIGIKSSIFSDIKYDKRRQPDRRL